jgi:mannitol/fructose-specific phosphotransferase system IIA component (Ntr-type)/NhaP-type Na+/H+ or K+/H+ antiporter
MLKIPGADPLLILATVLLTGMTLGWLATRVHLPSVTGQIIAGLVIGQAGLGLFDEQAVAGLQPLTHLALAWIGAVLGAHLNLRRLRNAGKRLGLLCLCESVLTPALVFSALALLTDVRPAVAALFAAVAISTAPATVLAIVRESRARGVFVKTLLAGVALGSVACILLFELARSVVRVEFDLGASFSAAILVGPLGSLAMAACLGSGLAVLAHLFTTRVVRPDRLAATGTITLLLAFGLATWLDTSPLLACLFLGFVQSNLSPAHEGLLDRIFGDFEPVILCVFFTVAGMALTLERFADAGLVAAVFFAARAAGKLLSPRVAMTLAGVPDRVRRNLGLALLPQAGLAVGLVLLIQDDPVFAEISQLFTATVLSVVTVNEIIGPVLTRIALVRSGEAGMDRPRLVDFLQEENIVTDLRGRTKEEAIERLTDVLIRSHHLSQVDPQALRRSILEREAEVSTCLGGGLAVPHGELPEGLPMVGVMGLSREGLLFETPDDRPIHCMVLLATPRGERDRHLEVLAALARTLATDPSLQQQLYNARSPAHAYDVLHGEETEDFNYFLEDGSEEG